MYVCFGDVGVFFIYMEVYVLHEMSHCDEFLLLDFVGS